MNIGKRRNAGLPSSRLQTAIGSSPNKAIAIFTFVTITVFVVTILKAETPTSFITLTYLMANRNITLAHNYPPHFCGGGIRTTALNSTETSSNWNHGTTCRLAR